MQVPPVHRGRGHLRTRHVAAGRPPGGGDGNSGPRQGPARGPPRHAHGDPLQRDCQIAGRPHLLHLQYSEPGARHGRRQVRPQALRRLHHPVRHPAGGARRGLSQICPRQMHLLRLPASPRSRDPGRPESGGGHAEDPVPPPPPGLPRPRILDHAEAREGGRQRLSHPRASHVHLQELFLSGTGLPRCLGPAVLPGLPLHQHPLQLLPLRRPLRVGEPGGPAPLHPDLAVRNLRPDPGAPVQHPPVCAGTRERRRRRHGGGRAARLRHGHAPDPHQQNLPPAAPLAEHRAPVVLRTVRARHGGRQPARRVLPAVHEAPVLRGLDAAGHDQGGRVRGERAAQRVHAAEPQDGAARSEYCEQPGLYRGAEIGPAGDPGGGVCGGDAHDQPELVAAGRATVRCGVLELGPPGLPQEPGSAAPRVQPSLSQQIARLRAVDRGSTER
mmetsp:Transcript_30124/g.59617  ORF Transcript_30124/g.59617 Transcript_30124/m.59617 type:complete len:442 (+) Transcript_30124:746-2071(+)